MLLAASNVNAHVELVGQDIDARCVRIAAINLGLRGKYGWVICGNSLTRDVQFVYRIGSFFHESPNGRRRGVIRSVPPEQCPVLREIMDKTREDLFDQVDETADEGQSTEPTLPTIIEVPQWAFRLEQRLATLEPSEHSREQEADALAEKDQEPPADEERQLRLF